MTRDEAIKVLSSYDVNGVWADVDGKPYNAEEQAEAFDMAIEALQGKSIDCNYTCSDCVHQNKTYEEEPCHSCFNNDGAGYEPVKHGEWIPCDERLPDNKTYVLTTIQVSGRQPHVRSGFYHDGFFHNDNGDTWRAIEKPLKAWMPLPEPYKEDGE